MEGVSHLIVEGVGALTLGESLHVVEDGDDCDGDGNGFGDRNRLGAGVVLGGGEAVFTESLR